MIKLYLKIFFFSSLLINYGKLSGQTSDFTAKLRIDIPASIFTTDHLGNIYIGYESNLTKYDATGTKTSTWSSGNNGVITYIDAGDPLKLIVFCGDFGVVHILDRNLAPASTPVNLTDFNISPPVIICSTSEGGFWLYNPLFAQLQRFDANLKPVFQSPDLYYNGSSPEEPFFMQEHEKNIYLNDLVNGLFVTDKFGTIKRIFPLKNLRTFQCFASDIIFLSSNNIVYFNFNTLKERLLPIPSGNILDVRTDGKHLYILDNKGVSVYNTDF